MKKSPKPYKESSDTQLIAEDSLVIYNQKSNPIDAIVAILGGDKIYSFPVKDEYDLIALARKGLKKSSVVSVSKYLGITMEKMSQLINTSMRTFQRKSEHDHLSISASEQTIEVAEVIFKGLQVFGTRQKLNLWLNSSIPALNGCTPLSLLDTSFGIKLVLRTLVRLEHGVYN